MSNSTPTPGSARALLLAHLSQVGEDTLTGCTKALKPLTQGTVKSALSKNRDSFRCRLAAGKWVWSLAKAPSRRARTRRTRRTAKA